LENSAAAKSVQLLLLLDWDPSVEAPRRDRTAALEGIRLAETLSELLLLLLLTWVNSELFYESEMLLLLLLSRLSSSRKLVEENAANYWEFSPRYYRRFRHPLAD
jgi:hypothetical protein